MQLFLKLSPIWKTGWKVRRHVLQCEGPDPDEDEDKSDLGEFSLKTKTTYRAPEPEAEGNGDPCAGRVEPGGVWPELPSLCDPEPGLRVRVPGSSGLMRCAESERG